MHTRGIGWIIQQAGGYGKVEKVAMTRLLYFLCRKRYIA